MEVFDRYDIASLPQYCNKILNIFSRLERMSAMEKKMKGKYVLFGGFTYFMSYLITSLLFLRISIKGEKVKSLKYLTGVLRNVNILF